MNTVSKVIISVPRFFLVNRQFLFTTMLFYLFVILFASAFAQAAPTESIIPDLKGIIEEMTTLRPSTVNETIYSDSKASQTLGSSLESAGAEITSTTFNSIEDDGVSDLTLEFTTEGQVFSTVTTPITDDVISTLTPETTTESLIDSTTDGSISTVTPETTTSTPATETEISSITTPTTNDEISTLMPEITTESFLVSTTPNDLTSYGVTTTLTPEIITGSPTTESQITSITTPTTNDEISTLTPETTTESFLVSTTPIESTTDGVTTTLTLETTTAAPTSAFEAIDTTLNPSTIGVISTSTAETPTTEETAVQNNKSTATAHIFHTSQFVLKHETPEYCNWYQITCDNYLNNQSFCRYSLVGDCNNFKAYQIWPIKQLVRQFTYFPYTFNYQYVHKEQRSYGCYLYRVKCEHLQFANVKTEHCNYEYVGECSNCQMIHVINSSFY
ncbi:hypothetical protein G9C98_006535 [Cotesia typhae]|uniref:Uncharacterized protein n=1 Tax=Cotesia typhae TaxID=2053667 RepID=A0A8J5VA52_9HYME|nr:hypothetical protein G9C98_006535 [Cotesia typhae]